MIQGVLQGDYRLLSRAISFVENGEKEAQSLLASLYKKASIKPVIGITGIQGAGKSTLLDGLIHLYRQENKKVGVLAIDPTSPFSGGALLGDRIRMKQHFTDPGVYIRSMATRGSTGGISRATLDAIDVLLASPLDLVFVETIGVGQDEVDVMQAVDTVVVVLMPDTGDDVQTLKAGLMEIADIYVINKADKAGVEKTRLELESMLNLQERTDWKPPICTTIALQEKGLEAVKEAIEKHLAFLVSSEEGQKRSRQKAEYRLRKAVAFHALQNIERRMKTQGLWQRALDAILAHDAHPREIVNQWLKEMGW